MKHAFLPFLACWALVAGGAPAMAAEAGVNRADVVAQDLAKVVASGRVGAALWTRRADSYTLQLVYGVSGGRASYFIGNTVANLRGLDPAMSGRTLALVDGRRVAQPVATQTAPKPPKSPDQVWLLRTNGTQILPYFGSEREPANCAIRCIAQEVTYKFSLADGDEAVAAVVRIDDEYYVEKLQPLKPAQ